MKRAAMATFALFFACSPAAIAQYENRGAANSTYGNQDTGRWNRDAGSYDQSQASNGSQSDNTYYADRGETNSGYGQQNGNRWSGNAQNDTRGHNGSRPGHDYADRSGQTDNTTQRQYNNRGSTQANNSAYGDRHTNGNDRSARQGEQSRSMANNGDNGFRGSSSHSDRAPSTIHGGDQRGGYPVRYHAASELRRHCAWHYGHRACYRVRY